MKSLKIVLNRLNTVLNFVMASFLLVSIVVIGLQVFTRYVLNYTPPWSEELARYLNVWITMLGIGVVLRRNEHIRLDYLETRLEEGGRKTLKQIMDGSTIILTSVFLVFLTYGGFKILKAASRQIAPGLKIPMIVVYLAVPIGSIIAILYTIEKIFEAVCDKDKRGK